MTAMLAARAHAGADALALEKIAVPEPRPGDVLVRVASAGLAPSLMKLLARGSFRHLPSTPGHEIAGTVAAVGPDADASLVGKRVRVHPGLSCRDCAYCRTDREQMCASAAMLGSGAHGTGPMPLYERYHDGGLAEFVRAPAWLVDVLPDRVGFDVAAKVQDFGNALRAVRTADLPPGGTLVVTAATGTMGTATVKLAPHLGASRLILVGRSAERLAAVAAISPLPARTVALDGLGADWETSGGLTRRLLDLAPGGADAVVDYLPHGAGTGQATAALATGATLVAMGGNRSPFPHTARDLQHHCWRVAGTRGCTRADTAAVLDLLGSGALTADELITHRFPLADVGAALTALTGRTEPIWMAVVNP
ncbi:L-threonine 3-dehydrogenase [Actinomadura rubteroloni]|uniref:L-threonine 3-dehydrogenase n=1 Tax=Actinomadura rubteroloni TaxID=1926885 RepID=A0A2P4UH34_9ACTN|nr:alcohol dehydrogenase catalytic domain-containing protein [Actinomadura rubteroloni]POM24350.1 L-threonine 3-dehydrogenase [Actinomadura rubteroloni]